jgi:cytidylate kinase
MTRIHITGGPGTGKTTLARALADRHGLPLLDLDGRGLAELDRLPRPLDYEAIAAARQDASRRFAAGNAWISEGSNILVAHPLFERADVIVVLYTPWRVASYRILSRHVKASLARNNRFPGLRRLYRFWRWSARFYADTNPGGLNEWGTPTTQLTLEAEVAPYGPKVMRCRTRADIEALMRRLETDISRPR